MDVISISKLKDGNSMREEMVADMQSMREEMVANMQSTGMGGSVNPCSANEIPDGFINTFTFRHPDTTTTISNVAQWSEKVYVDGTLQVRGTDYLFLQDTGTVVFHAGHIPTGGTVITMDGVIVPTSI